MNGTGGILATLIAALILLTVWAIGFAVIRILPRLIGVPVVRMVWRRRMSAAGDRFTRRLVGANDAKRDVLLADLDRDMARALGGLAAYKTGRMVQWYKNVLGVLLFRMVGPETREHAIGEMLGDTSLLMERYYNAATTSTQLDRRQAGEMWLLEHEGKESDERHAVSRQQRVKDRAL